MKLNQIEKLLAMQELERRLPELYDLYQQERMTPPANYISDRECFSQALERLRTSVALDKAVQTYATDGGFRTDDGRTVRITLDRTPPAPPGMRFRIDDRGRILGIGLQHRYGERRKNTHLSAIVRECLINQRTQDDRRAPAFVDPSVS